MTEAALRKLVQVWQRRLGLESWDIAIKATPEHPKIDDQITLARVQRHQFYDKATLEYGPGILDEGQLPESVERDLIEDGQTLEEMAETVVVHELLHLACRDIMEAGDLVREHLAPPAVAIWDSAWKRAEEALVERIAVALVRSWNS